MRFPSISPALLLCVATTALGGCYFVRSPSRPIPALTFRHEAGLRQGCLVIFVPGFLDEPDTFRSRRLPHELAASGARCDAVAVDLHLGYYAEGGVARMLHEDVLAPAVARGYEEIWVVGISMGGLGATLLARDHPELIDGLILLSPFLGEEAHIAAIEEAGGLEAWQPPAELPARMDGSSYSLMLWSWLHRYTTDPDGMPVLHLGWARGERLERGIRLLAAVLPEGRVHATEGRHEWSTWVPLFRAILESARPGTGRGGLRETEVAAR